METPADQEALPKPDPAQELVDMAERPPYDPEKFELFLRVRTILAKIRPELDSVFSGLFEKGRHERDARTFLGRVREVLFDAKLTDKELGLLLQATKVPGFSLIDKFIVDKYHPKEKPPIEQRVIREISVTSPTPPGGSVPMFEPNISGSPRSW